MNESKISKQLNIADINIKLDMAIPCALIISELVSNILKYAFPNDKKGLMSITILADADNSIKMIVEDNGIGFPENMGKKDFLGLHLVKNLVDQIKGDMKIINNLNKGTKFIINFKLEV